MKPTLDRIDFRSEQLLAAADLAQASRRASDLLWLHTARAHGVWGVVRGYRCRIEDPRVGLTVGSGVALDRCGRELLNPVDRIVPLPVLPIDTSAYIVDLVARWAPTDGLRGACGSRQMPPECAELRWEIVGPVADELPYSRRVRLGIDVPIARLTLPAAANDPVDLQTRPVAHALVRPKIASGQVLQSTVRVVGSFANWRMTVPTGSAGFDATSVPVYLVTLDLHPFGDRASFGPGPAMSGQLPPDLLIRMGWRGPLASIETRRHDEFTLRVVSATGEGWGQKAEPGLNPVPVSWIGIDASTVAPFSGSPASLSTIRSRAVLP